MFPICHWLTLLRYESWMVLMVDTLQFFMNGIPCFLIQSSIITSGISHGAKIAFWAGNIKTIARDWTEIRPTIVCTEYSISLPEYLT